MKKIDPNEPAMPIQYDEEYGDNGRKINRIFEGLTIRQYYAGLAMQGYISAGSNGMPDGDKLAILAVETADALIKELNKDFS